MRKLVSIIVHLSSQCLKCLRELLTISDDVWRMAGGLISAKSPTGMLCDVMKRTVEGSDHHVLKRDEALRIVSQIRSTAEVLQHHSSNWVAALDTVQSELRPALLKYSGSLASCSEAISARKVATSPRLAGPSIRTPCIFFSGLDSKLSLIYLQLKSILVSSSAPSTKLRREAASPAPRRFAPLFSFFFRPATQYQIFRTLYMLFTS